MPPKCRKLGPPVLLRCLEEGCSWEKEGTHDAARYHAASGHGGHVHVFKPATHEAVQAHVKVLNRGKVARYRERKRSAPGASSWQRRGGGGGVGEQGECDQEDTQTRRFVYFPTESNSLPGQGDVHGMVWDRRRRQGGGGSGVNGSSRPGVVVMASMDASSEGALHVAVSWVVGLLQARGWEAGAVRMARGTRQRRGLLYKADEVLVVHVSECDTSLDGGSLGVAAALSLLAVALEPTALPPPEQLPDDAGGASVVVTGGMDLTGAVRPVAGLAGKIKASWEFGASVFLVPASSYQALDLSSVGSDLPEPERERMRRWAERAVRPYSTLLEAIHAILDPAFPALPAVVGGAAEAVDAPQRGHWVGVAYTLSPFSKKLQPPGCGVQQQAIRHDTTGSSPTAESLVVQVGSANREGRGRGQGKGLVLTSGAGGASMKHVVLRAREWVLHNRTTILQAIDCPEQVAQACDWEREDLLVHFASGGQPGMQAGAFTAAVAVAMVSFFTGRRVRRQTAVLGSLFPKDRWLSGGQLVADEATALDLKAQGFDAVMVPDKQEDIAQHALQSFVAQGVEVVAAYCGGEDEAGHQQQQEPGGEPGRPEYRFVPMLRHLLLPPAAEEGEEAAAAGGAIMQEGV